ncbi:MAG: thiamine-phosphate kinase [candidate division WOR-3 bacterium]
MRIDRLGEAGLIRLIQQTIKPCSRARLGIEDDAAVLADGTVITTDAYAEGVHFDSAYMTHYDIGRRCACAALSDIVAMAAEPDAVLVSLAVPPAISKEAIRQLYRGIGYVCSRLNCEIVGGDTIALDHMILTITATGHSRRPCFRSGAKPGDSVYLTGYAGLAETGRIVLSYGTFGSRSGWTAAVRRHLLPLPRIAAMRKLAPHLHALIDTSDGLATDAGHIARLSRVRIELDASAIPITPATRRLCAMRGIDPLEFCLASGEDYELLFTAPVNLARVIADTPIVKIGTVKRGHGLFLRDRLGIRPLKACGYDHLRPNLHQQAS